MKERYWNLDDIIIILTSFFALSTITQQLFPFSTNRIVGIILLLCLMIDLFYNASRRKVCFWLAIIIIFMLSFLFAEDIKYNLESYIYWITTLLLLHKMTRTNAATELMDAFSRNTLWIKIILYLYSLCNFLFLFKADCYESYAGWGNAGYFKAYASTPHTLASVSCLFLTLACYYMMLEGIDVMIGIGILVAVLSVFQSGARVFLISAVCIVLVVAFILFRNRQYRYFFYFIGGIAFIFLFIKSGMMDKFEAVFSNKSADVMAAFTNARSTIWTIDIREFSNSGWFQKLLGHGFDYVPKINQMYYGDPIWAHNDFIQILLSVGIIGLVIYLLSIFDVLTKMKCSGVLVKLLLGVYVILPAFMNGLYIYQHLVYSVFYLWMIGSLYDKKEIYLESIIRKGLVRKI